VSKASEVVVLIGPMGVGKTTIGRKLAKVLQVPFIDTDNLIADEHGPIPAIFEERGEPEFRRLEEKAMDRAISETAVVATGGGAVLSELTRKRLKAVTVIYLATDGKHIGSRLKNGNRPLLQNGLEDWRRIYEERKPLYKSTADFEINTSGQPINVSIKEILKKLGKNVSE
jgi:shikimate kinase